jgi:hypothetical protein
MKTITLICLASLFIAFSAHSQISKGAVLLGGNLGYSTSDNDNGTNDYKNHSYFISPSLGFVVNENKVFGVNLSYAHGKYESSAEEISNNYGVGFFYRRYLPLGKNFYFYGQGQIDAGFGKRKQTATSNYANSTSKSLSISAFPGVAYAISKKIHLEIAMNHLLSLGYYTNKYQNTTTPDAKTSILGFAVNANPASNLGVGFRILLGNK